MTISRIGAATAAGTSLTPSWSGAGAGEMEIAWAFRSGNATPPAVPSGWTTLLSAGGNTCGGVLAYRFAPTSSNVASGTFTNATQLIITRYKGVKGLGNVAGSNASGTSISYPALTMIQTAGHSWIFGAGGHRTATNVNTAPSGMTNITSVGNICAVHDTNAGVSSWAGASATVNASSGHESMTLELLADNGAWSIYNSAGSSQWSLSTENKVAVSTANPANTNCIRTFTSHSTGKWYFLARLLAYGSTSDLVTGWCTATASMTVWPGGANNNGIAFGFNSSGGDNQWINHTAANNSSVYNHPAAANDFFHFCIDLDAGLVWVKHDSMTDWNNDASASPDSGTGGFAYTDVKGSELFPFTGTGNNGSQFAINTTDTSSRPADASNFTGWDVDALAGRTATATLAVGAVTLSAAGAEAIAGSATLAAGAVTSSSAGTAAISGSATLSAGAVTSSAAAAAEIDASASLSVGAVSLAADGTTDSGGIDAQADLQVGAVTASAAGTNGISASATMPQGAVTAAAQATSAISASGTLPVGAVTVSCAAAAKIDASASLGQSVTASAAGTAAISASATLAVGAVTLQSDGHQSAGNTAQAALQVGAVTCAAAATNRVQASAILAQGVTVSGQGAAAIAAIATLSVGAVQGAGAGLSQIDASATLGVGAVTMSATAIHPNALVPDPENFVWSSAPILAVLSRGYPTAVLSSSPQNSVLSE